MGQISKIEWTDATWNPVRGCSRVSEGCRNCYAERVAARFSRRGGPFQFFADQYQSGSKWTGKVELIESKLEEPLRWKKPTRIFVNSMSDLFHEALPDVDIDRVFAIMALCPQHTFQVLTKRPERMLKWFANQGGASRWAHVESAMDQCTTTLDGRRTIAWNPIEGRWPLKHVWLGVSIEDQKTADERIPLLLQTAAAVRFVSYEPALGPVELKLYVEWERCGGGHRTRDTRLNWVIVGGESGPGARPFEISWARNVIDQCRAIGVACFVKQLGAHPMVPSTKRLPGETAKDWANRERVEFLQFVEGTLFGNRTGDPQWNGYEAILRDRKGGDPSEWPDDLRVREFPEVMA